MSDRWFLVKLDLERIRQSMSREDRCEYSLQHVQTWLRDAGFQAVDDGWLVKESDLGQVDPSEVVDIQPHDAP